MAGNFVKVGDFRDVPALNEIAAGKRLYLTNNADIDAGNKLAALLCFIVALVLFVVGPGSHVHFAGTVFDLIGDIGRVFRQGSNFCYKCELEDR